MQRDRFLLDVAQQCIGKGGQAHFGVAVRRGRVAVNRAEVALPLDQRVAHGEVLCQPHGGVVDRAITVGVVITEDIPDDLGRLHRRAAGQVAPEVHAVEDAPLHRLEAVASIRQRPVGDDREAVQGKGMAQERPELLLPNVLP